MRVICHLAEILIERQLAWASQAWGSQTRSWAKQSELSCALVGGRGWKDLQRKREAEGLAQKAQVGGLNPFLETEGPGFGDQRVFGGISGQLQAHWGPFFWQPGPKDGPEVFDFALAINTTYQYRVMAIYI